MDCSHDGVERRRAHPRSGEILGQKGSLGRGLGCGRASFPVSLSKRGRASSEEPCGRALGSEVPEAAVLCVLVHKSPRKVKPQSCFSGYTTQQSHSPVERWSEGIFSPRPKKGEEEDSKTMEANLPQQLKKSSSFLSSANDAICSAVSKAMSFVGGSQQTLTNGERSLQRRKSSLTCDLRPDKESLAEISLDEVSCHDSIYDCWIVVYDRVFDITNFLEQHPGGEEVLMEHAGRDATIAFSGVGHSREALRALEKYFIGRLPSRERIYSSGGKKVFDALSSLSFAS